MFKINILLLCVLVSTRYINGQIENLIGLPVEYRGPATYDDWESEINNDIWSDDDNNNVQPEDDSPGKLLETLCTKFNLELHNQIIDCNDVKIVPKSFGLNNHSLRKREATEDALEEGSGDSPAEEAAKENKEDTDSSAFKPQSLALPAEEVQAPEVPATPSEDKPLVEEAKNEETPITSEVLPSEDKVQAVEDNTVVPADTTVAPDAVPSEDKQETAAVPTEDKVQTVEDKEAAGSSSPFKTQSLQVPVDEQTVPEIKEPANTNVAEATEKPDQTLDETPKEVPEKPAPENETPKPVVPEESATGAPVKEEEKVESVKVELSEIQGKESEGKKDGIQSKQENINTQQSGNAVISNGGDMTETETKLRHMQPNESIKATEGAEAKSGASETPDKNRKDNKLLIILFAAVLAVGAAAFAYNYIKKKKNKNLAARAAAATQANGNGGQRTDPEEGREMKPLMTASSASAGQSNSVEYKDEK